MYENSTIDVDAQIKIIEFGQEIKCTNRKGIQIKKTIKKSYHKLMLIYLQAHKYFFKCIPRLTRMVFNTCFSSSNKSLKIGSL